MTGGFAAAFLDNDARVVPRHALDLLSSLSPASLQSLASSAASEMAESLLHSTQSQKADNLSPPDDNEAFAAMCVIVTTCARDAGARTPAERRQQLYALGVEDEDLQTKLLPVLADVVPSVELVLENTSFDFAHVVDVSWRLDFVLRSSSAGSIHTPLYFVELKLQSPSAANSGLQTVAFSCSVEQLRSLVYRIQEAANEVEKLAGGAPSQLRTSADWLDCLGTRRHGLIVVRCDVVDKADHSVAIIVLAYHDMTLFEKLNVFLELRELLFKGLFSPNLAQCVEDDVVTQLLILCVHVVPLRLECVNKCQSFSLIHGLNTVATVFLHQVVILPHKFLDHGILTLDLILHLVQVARHLAVVLFLQILRGLVLHARTITRHSQNRFDSVCSHEVFSRLEPHDRFFVSLHYGCSRCSGIIELAR